MRALLAGLTALVLFIHAASGCCWHHHHEGEAHGGTPGTATAHCDHHRHGNEHHGQPHGPCKSGSKCQGVCTYLPVQRTQLNAPQLVVALDLVGDAAVAGCGAQRTSTSWARVCCPSDLRPPLRLHLLHQVLVI
jgi:hypothetical protein